MIASVSSRMLRFATLLIMAVVAVPASAQSQGPTEEVVRIWPGAAPRTETWSGEEIERYDPSPTGRVLVKTNITVPTMTVFRPARGKANGTAMIVLPGGAFQVLAWKHEGIDVGRWLAEQGITAFVLKYRVRPYVPDPNQPPASAMEAILQGIQPGRKIAIEDTAQAVRVVRRDAARYGIQPNRVGVIGFSAGAIATMGLLLEGDPTARPNFAAPMYGVPMVEKPKVPADAPPLFIASAQDDFLSAGSIEIYNLWSNAHRPAELHIFDKGGHGFGMRRSNLPVDNWPTIFRSWLASHGYLPSPNAVGRR